MATMVFIINIADKVDGSFEKKVHQLLLRPLATATAVRHAILPIVSVSRHTVAIHEHPSSILDNAIDAMSFCFVVDRRYGYGMVVSRRSALARRPGGLRRRQMKGVMTWIPICHVE